MNRDEELRAKALELAVQTLALLPEAKRLEQFQKLRPEDAVIQISQPYLEYLKDQPS